jgi:hypothetical protein
MRFLDLDRLASVTELLALLFYSLMAVALLAVLVGVPGTGLLLLLLGAAIHVVRFSLELVADARSPRRA